MEDHHIGHRERLRKRFLVSGFNGFSEREILEYFLCLCIHRKDVKPIADRLLKAFGSISNVIDQTVSDLQKIEGIGETAATNITALREFFSIYFINKAKHDKLQLTKMSGLVELLRASIGQKPNEVLFAIFLNAKNEMLLTKELGEGTVTEAAAFPRKVVEEALKQKATSIILAHNHPGGIAEPSENDITFTNTLKNALALMDISLQDHIILSDDNYFSFKRDNLL